VRILPTSSTSIKHIETNSNAAEDLRFLFFAFLNSNGNLNWQAYQKQKGSFRLYLRVMVKFKYFNALYEPADFFHAF
jgi:hypothetical protein